MTMLRVSSPSVSQGSVDANDRMRGRRLQRAREDADMEQKEVGQLIGRTRVTISRWENGSPIPDDMLAMLIGIYAAAGASIPIELSALLDVPRATSPRLGDAPPTFAQGSLRLNTMIAAFERELVRSGATDEEADFIRAVLSHPATVHMVTMPELEQLPPNLLEKRYAVIMAGLREIIAARSSMRDVGLEPIKPKDLPAEQAKRRAELDAETPTSKSRTK